MLARRGRATPANSTGRSWRASRWSPWWWKRVGATRAGRFATLVWIFRRGIAAHVWPYPRGAGTGATGYVFLYRSTSRTLECIDLYWALWPALHAS